MDDVTKQIVGQFTGMLIQSIFTYLMQAGLTSDEIEVLFNKERAEFRKKNPNTLPSIDR